MPDTDLRRRNSVDIKQRDTLSFIAVCKRCGRPYSGSYSNEGEIVLGGGMTACACGSDAFSLHGKGVDSAKTDS